MSSSVNPTNSPTCVLTPVIQKIHQKFPSIVDMEEKFISRKETAQSKLGSAIMVINQISVEFRVYLNVKFNIQS